MMDNDKYTVTYTLQCEYENVDLPGEPSHSLIHIVFDGLFVLLEIVDRSFVISFSVPLVR